MSMSMSKSNLLPVELITYILCRVPVKSLLRFRCVSKQWCSLIDSPYFMKLNLNHSLKTNTNLSLILSHKKEGLFYVEFDTLNTAIRLNNNPPYTRVLGSCNGLVALFNSNEDLALWNPSTRKYHKLPATPIEVRSDYFMSIDYGFGYDPVSDDYKLVRLVLLYYCREVDDSEVKVYSLKSNSWRRTRDFPYCHCYFPQGNGILANNALHWVVSRTPEKDSETLIVAFDLRIEEYIEVPQPEYMDNDHFMCVASLGGCLCVYDFGNFGDHRGCLSFFYYGNVGDHMWVMKEYGVKESWSKLFSMERRDLLVRPLAYSKSGDRVLLDHYGYADEIVVWYDLRRKRAEVVRIHGAPKSFDAANMCVGSLVPLNGGQQAGGN